MSLKIYCKDEECLPYKRHYTDAGLDIRSAENAVIFPGESRMIRTGIHVEIPEGYVGLIFPRSGLATKYGIGLANSVGVIDSDYRGEIKCVLTSKTLFTVRAYERIAQLVIAKHERAKWEIVEVLSETERGTGGFGSTGI